VACALETQKSFAAEPWGEISALRIRAGLHAGEAEYHASAGTPEGDYFGPSVNCAARIMSAAWGGQILLTPEVTRVSPVPAHATLIDLGQHLLKNVRAPQQLYQLDHPQLPRHEFPLPRTLSGQSIRQAVDQRGAQMAGLEPQAMGIALLSATLLPALQGELDPKTGALEGNLGVLEDLGALSLRRFVAGFADRLRAEKPLPAPELKALLQRDLQTQWQHGSEPAVALRADASRLLQAVHGVEAVMAAATKEIRELLARGLADLGTQFREFRWMLAGVQDTLAEVRTRQALQLALQREQLDLQRQQLVKTNLILQRQPLAAVKPLVEALPEVAAPADAAPAEVACPYMGLAAFEAQDAEYFFGREELVRTASWSPDGSQVATGLFSNQTIIWDYASGEQIARLIHGESDMMIDSVAWAPDGSRIASGSDDSTAKVWDTSTCRSYTPCITSRQHSSSPLIGLPTERTCSLLGATMNRGRRTTRPGSGRVPVAKSCWPSAGKPCRPGLGTGRPTASAL
jgi:hypothetical protein